MSSYNILVTGVGAIIGYGIIKSLRICRYQVNIIGIDIFDDAVGRVWCDEFVQGVRADSPDYPIFIQELVAKRSIDLIIPGIEQDVDALARMVYKGGLNTCEVVLNTAQALSIFNNKKLTYQLQQELGLPTIPFATSEDATVTGVIESLGLPCILKPNVSYAGKGLRTIHNKDELTVYCGREGYVFQRKVNTGIEYTLSVFGTGDGRYCNSISFKRWLGPDGATHKAEVYPFFPFQQQVAALVARTRSAGPTNFQFIESEDDGTPLLLEVNPRVSSSSSMRTKFGINEPEMCIEFYLEKNIPAKRDVRSGRTQRFIDEVVEYEGHHR